MSPLNFRLKIRTFCDSELKNRSCFYIRYIIDLKAIYGQEMAKIDFSTPATKSRVSSIIPDSRS